MKKVLLTAFHGTSSQLLVEDCQYSAILLPNDKVKDAEKLFSLLQTEAFDYIIAFGQRGNIKNKVHIEITAQNGNHSISTGVDVYRLCDLFLKNGIPAKVSHNAGTSYCNHLYWNGLTYIASRNLHTKMVFVHIPFTKNVDDMTHFREGIFQTIDTLSSF